MAFSRPDFSMRPTRRGRTRVRPVAGSRSTVALSLAAAVLTTGGLTAAMTGVPFTSGDPAQVAVRDEIDPSIAAFAQGVDVSKWQHGDVDWDSAHSAGRGFAFVKATDGAAPGNEHYTDDMSEARAAGLLVGSYHKAHPGQDASAQATAFARTIQAVGGQQLPPVLDIEISEGLDPDELVDWTRTFLTDTERLTGRKPIVYTYRNFWIHDAGNSTAFTSYPLWIAEYNRDEPTFPLVGGWSEWAFWQYAGNDGRVDGFSTAVDEDAFAGSLDDLKTWLGPVSPGGGTKGPGTTNGKTGTGAPATPARPDPAARGGVPAAGSSIPTKISIPTNLIPAGKLPPGIKLPATIDIPAGSVEKAAGALRK